MCTKKERFHRRSKGVDFKKSIFSRLGGVLETSFGSTTLQEVGILHTLVYFHPKCYFGSISTRRSRFALFSALRGCLAWVKTTSIAVLRLVCGWFCVDLWLCVICPKKCLDTIWIKKNYPDC